MTGNARCKVRAKTEGKESGARKRERERPSRDEEIVMRDSEYMKSGKGWGGGRQRGNNSPEQVRQNRSRLRAPRRIYSPSDRQ